MLEGSFRSSVTILTQRLFRYRCYAYSRTQRSGGVILDVSSFELAWFGLTFSASVERCQLKYIRLDGEIDEEKAPADDDVPDTDSLALVLQRDPG